MSVCSEKCWTRVPCPECGGLLWPAGRSAPLGTHECEHERHSRVNTCHLFSEHDSDRHYFDPEGWAEHESTCKECNPDDDDD